MFICLCNAVKESQVSAVRESGAGTVKEVFQALGCNPVCGKCVPYLRECVEGCAARELG